ncbi:MAG TPA: HEAT repeat domain-containing protein [Planctomycetota bacterium]|nr:HEAT repeat domain-containing protein [Planctomycetota bacterium]HRR80508.1 HEAT repeat domain-containing protein [Planctomycetota bacterium]HRT95785.1 HEAT repeat domain-containing protein [Planctomycetota bacterium]
MPNLPFRPPPGVHPTLRERRVAQRAQREEPAERAAGGLRRVPWFLLSCLIHACLLVLTALIFGSRPVPVAEVSGHVFEVGLLAERPSPAEVPKPREPERPPIKVEEPPPPPSKAEPEEQPPPVAPPPAAPEPARRDEPAAAQATPVLEVAGGPAPARDVFASRGPSARETAVRQWGGSAASERAVDAALEWLRVHQEPDGRWNDGDPQLKLAPGLSGLAVLAFLGKGHTHTDEGRYRDTVAHGLRYLLSIQTPEGRFGEPYLVGAEKNNRYLMYHQGIATMALAEAYAMTRDPALREPVRRAVAFIQRAQQDAGGWDYGDAPTGRNDTSVTGWQVMALKSAHAAGIEVGWETLFGIMRHLHLNTSAAGEVIYANREPGPWRRGPGMVAVGLFSYLALGWPRDCALAQQQADLLLANLPDWADMNRNDPRDPADCLHTMYYWYYGTLALFQMGGHWWTRWNAHLRDLLIARQCSDGDRKGSWDPPDRGFDAAGGRVYTTALNALTLEVYYRYLPFYREGALDALDVLEKATRVRSSDATRRRALLLLGSFNTPRAQDLLVGALDDPDPATRATAQRVLVDQKCERVVPDLLRQLESVSALARMQAVSSLTRFGDKRFVPHLIKALRDPERVVRDRAIQGLRKLTGEGFGFLADASAQNREEAVQLWERWWRGEVAQPPPGGIRGRVLVVDEQAPNVVVLDVGGDAAVHRGQRFEVRRDGKVIAVLQAEKVEPTLTMARVLERRGEPLREGDAIQSVAESPVAGAGGDQ